MIDDIRIVIQTDGTRKLEVHFAGKEKWTAVDEYSEASDNDEYHHLDGTAWKNLLVTQ